KTLQSRGTHLLHVLKNHMIANRFDDNFDLLPGKPKLRHYAFRHFRAKAIVTIKTNPILGWVKRTWHGLADYVQKNSQRIDAARFRAEQAQHFLRMHEHIAFRVKLLWLLASFQPIDCRKDNSQQPALIKQLKAAQAVWIPQDLHDL